MSYDYDKSIQNKEEEERKKREEALREAVVRRFLTPKARERLANLNLVNPDLVKDFKTLIYNLAVSGRLREPLDDETVKDMLYKIQSKKKKEYRFRGLF